MTYFSQIICGELKETPMLVVEEKEIFLKLNAEDLPEKGYGLLQDDWYVYCVNWHDKEHCSLNTTKVPILYFYKANEYDVSFSSCQRIEYTSNSLVKLMCAYKISDNDVLVSINDEFPLDNITLRFFGHKIFSEQQNIYYEAFNPAIILESTEPLEPDQTWRYVRAIDDFLRLVFFERRIAMPNIKLIDDNNQYLPFFVVKNGGYDKHYPPDFNNVYDEIKEQIPKIFHYVLKHQIKSSFFEQYYMCENLQNLFLNTYSNFDKLSQKKYGLVEENQDLKKFKNKIWKTVEKDEDYKSVEDNIKGLKDKIMSYGTQLGHKPRLKKAFDDNLKTIPERANFYNMYDEKIVNRICDLRAEIVHEGKTIEFTNWDKFCLEKFQWITYLILLRQIKIDDNVLEEWMNRVMGVG